MELRVKKLHEQAQLPRFARADDAGFDLTCTETTELLPQERKAVSTGLQIVVPKNHVGLIMDRGSMAFERGVHCIGGVIDAGYRGEWKVVMINLSPHKVILEQGQRIAQGLIVPLAPVAITEVAELEETERGHGRFGSTGK